MNEVTNLKIVLLGDSNAGKSSYLNVLKYDGFDFKLKETIGVDFCSCNIDF